MKRVSTKYLKSVYSEHESQRLSIRESDERSFYWLRYHDGLFYNWRYHPKKRRRSRRQKPYEIVICRDLPNYIKLLVFYHEYRHYEQTLEINREISFNPVNEADADIYAGQRIYEDDIEPSIIYWVEDLNLTSYTPVYDSSHTAWVYDLAAKNVKRHSIWRKAKRRYSVSQISSKYCSTDNKAPCI